MYRYYSFIGRNCTDLQQKNVWWFHRGNQKPKDRKHNDQKKKTNSCTQKFKHLATYSPYANIYFYVLGGINCELGQFNYVGLFPYWMPHFPTYLSSSYIGLCIRILVCMKTLNTCIENGCLNVLVFFFSPIQVFRLFINAILIAYERNV